MVVRKQSERSKGATGAVQAPGARKRRPSRPTKAKPAAHRPAPAGAQLELIRQADELQRAQARLTASRRRYLQLFDLAPVGYVVVDRAGAIQELNLLASELLGVSRARLQLGTPFAVYLSQASQRVLSKHLEAVFAYAPQVTCELEASPRGKESTLLWVHSALLPADVGPPVALMALTDITSRRGVQAGLEHLAQVADQNPASILLTDLQGDVVYVNRRFCVVTGYAPSDVVGKPAHFLLPDRQYPDQDREIWQSVRAGRIWRGEIASHRKDGTLLWEYAILAPLINDAGDIHGILAVREDVTLRRNLEEQLRHSQKMEAIGRLAGGIAHDYNNLLAIILTSVQLIERALGPHHEAIDDVHGIDKAAKRATELTRQLLAFSRKSVSQPITFDVSTNVLDWRERLVQLMGECTHVEFDLDPDPLTVRVDPMHLDQALMVLFANAKDAMSGQGKLTIATRKHQLLAPLPAHAGMVPAGRWVELAIRDTGVGMTPEVQARLFEPFFTTKEVGKGTGLGLATVFGLVKQAGGFVAVESAAGSGTVFRIFLPPAEEPADEEEIAAEPLEVLGSGQVILLAEDEHSLRKVVRRILEKNGYRVLDAENGQQALRRYEQQGPVDLVFSDVVMPLLGGQELMAEVRRRQPDVAVLLVSGHADGIDLASFAAEGVEFLPKPYTPEVLLGRIEVALQRRAQQMAALTS